MKKLLSLLLVFCMVSGMAVFAEEPFEESENTDVIELEFANTDIEFRSDAKGKFTNTEAGALKTGGIVSSFIEGKINIEIPGVYHFYADMILKSSGAIVQMSVDGQDIGNRVNTAGANDVIKYSDFGSVNIEEAGEVAVRFTLKDTTAGYDFGVKRIYLKKESVHVTGTCDKLGNLFVEGEEVKFGVSFKNMTNDALDMSINIEAESSFGTKVTTEPFDLSLSANAADNRTITLDVTEKNLYDFRVIVNIPSQKENIVYELPFSYAEKAIDYQGESIFGTCTHMTGLKKGSDRLGEMMEMIDKSGIHYIRDEFYWDQTELEKGKYTYYAEDYINALNEIGIKPMIVLSYSNKFYGVPHNEEGYEAFGEYAAALARHLGDKVYGFEVWNEWNGGTWNGGYGNEEYVNIIKSTYTHLKEVDPNIKVAAGAAITAPYFWFEQLFELGAFDYCDIISYHPYCMPDNPDQKTYRGNIEDNYENMYMVMQKYGDAKEQWITEWGWYTGTGGSYVSDQTQAAYITRGYINGMAYGIDKIFMYDFKNDGMDEAETEHNYGMIRSWEDSETVQYAPKLSYISTVAASNRLSGAEIADEYRPSTDARVYKFDKGNEEIIVMYYANDGKSKIDRNIKISIGGETAKMKASDIFGNSLDTGSIDRLDGNVIYLEGNKGQFNINDLNFEKRDSVLSLFGQWKTSDGIYVDQHHEFDTMQGAGGFSTNENYFTIGREERYNDIICDVDDGYINGGTNAIAMEIAYIDDQPSAGFYIEYSAADGSAKKTDVVKLSNTGGWKTEKIYIDDAGFTNSLDGYDFKIMLEDPANTSVSFRGVRIVKAGDAKARKLSIAFDNDELFEALPTASDGYYDIPGDEIRASLASHMKGFEYTEKGGRKCVYVSAVGEALYLYIDARDDILFGGFQPVKVSVDYYDEGEGKFTLGYDVGHYSNFKEAQTINITDTKEWKTAEFILDDCWWQNYTNNACDFRIALWAPSMGKSPEGIAFSGVRLEVLDGVPEKEWKEAAFNDITGHWSEDTVMQMAHEGVISGYEDGTIKPDNKIKVNEFIALLIQKMKYSGVEEGSAWDEGFITRAKELGLVLDGEFDDFEREITRAEIARIISRVTGAYSDNAADLNDFASIPEEFKSCIAGVYEKGIMVGDNDGKFYPERSATRAEAAVILSKI